MPPWGVRTLCPSTPPSLSSPPPPLLPRAHLYRVHLREGLTLTQRRGVPAEDRPAALQQLGHELGDIAVAGDADLLPAPQGLMERVVDVVLQVPRRGSERQVAVDLVVLPEGRRRVPPAPPRTGLREGAPAPLAVGVGEKTTESRRFRRGRVRGEGRVLPGVARTVSPGRRLSSQGRTSGRGACVRGDCSFPGFSDAEGRTRPEMRRAGSDRCIIRSARRRTCSREAPARSKRGTQTRMFELSFGWRTLTWGGGGARATV